MNLTGSFGYQECISWISFKMTLQIINSIHLSVHDHDGKKSHNIIHIVGSKPCQKFLGEIMQKTPDDIF